MRPSSLVAPRSTSSRRAVYFMYPGHGLAARINGWTDRATIAVGCPPIDDEYCNLFGECSKFRGWVPRDNEPQPSDEDGRELACMCLATQKRGLASSRPSCQSWLQLYRILAPRTSKYRHGNITPLYLAALFGWHKGVEWYLEQMPGRLTTSDLNHALRGAAISGSVELVDKPIQAGAKVLAHLSQIGSAMESADYCANPGAVDALFRHGARADETGDIYRPGGLREARSSRQ